jgi:predicted nucleic acid-binding protein
VRYFVDTNIIIDFFDKKPEAIAKITGIAKQADSLLFVNRLVYLESLRTIHRDHSRRFRDAKAVFERFEFLDINQEIYDQAIEFSRYCRSRGITLKGRCEAIDFLHFMTAQYYQLELLSTDGDMAKLRESYNDWKMVDQ